MSACGVFLSSRKTSQREKEPLSSRPGRDGVAPNIRKDVPGRPRKLVHLPKHILERAQEKFRIIAADYQGRQKLDNIDVVPRDLRKNVMFIQQRNDSGLRKKAFVQLMNQRPGGL